MKTINRMVAVTVVGAAILGLAGCGSDQQTATKGKAKKAPLVRAVAAEQTRLAELLETTGEVVAVNTVILQSTVEGPIAFCPWREGDRVDKVGQKLVEINRPLYRQEVLATEAALAVAQAKLDDLKAGARPEEIAQAKESVRHFEDWTSFAKADLERVRALVDSGSLPGEEAERARVDYVKCQTQFGSATEHLAMLEAGPTVTEIAIAQAAVDETVAKLALTQANLDECLLSAPFAGVVTEVLVRPGDLVTPRTPLLKMMDPSSLVIRFAVPETRAAEIGEGAEAVIRLDAHPGKTFKAKIERLYPALQRNTRTRMAEARILEPVELIPRLFARVSVVVKAADDAIVIPDKAILATPRGEKIVFVVSEGKASKRTVTIGLEQGRRSQVIDGVEAGEMVVIAGNEKLKDGASVQIATAPATTEKAPESASK